jgi:hypothetical protein
MQLSKPPKPKATRKRLKKEKFSMENFPPHITTWELTRDFDFFLERVQFAT